MSGNTFGQIFTLTSFGESHGPAIGGVIDGDFADITTAHLSQEFCVAEFLASWLCEQLASKCQNYNRADDGPDGPLWHRWLTVGIGLLVAQALDGVS